MAASSPDDLFVAFYEGTARTGGLLRAQSREALAGQHHQAQPL